VTVAGASPRTCHDERVTTTAARTTGETPTTADRTRQAGVTLALVVCVVGSLVGSGVLGGTGVADASGGAFAADSSLLTPAGTAFSIWSVVYAGLVAYVVVQWLPDRAASPRHRAIGWLAAASLVLNALWLVAALQGFLWTSVAVIVVLLAVLVEIVRRLTRHPGPDGLVERVAVDGAFGLYLGWVSVAVVANIAASSADDGQARTGTAAVVVSVLALVLVAAVAAVWAGRYGARVAVALAQSWGLAWVAVNRLSGAPESVPVGVAAVAAAIVPLAAVAVVRRRSVTPKEQA